MSVRFRSLLLVLLVATAGCSAVTISQPLPLTEKPADQARLEGIWSMSDDEPVYLRFASNGVAQLAGVEWDEDENAFHLERCELIFSDGEHARFLSLRCFEDGAWEEEYSFLRYVVTSDGDLVLWLPSPDAFKEAIAEGRLKGVVSQGKQSTSVTVTDDPAVLLALIDDPKRTDLFDYTEPMVVKKLQDTEK